MLTGLSRTDEAVFIAGVVVTVAMAAYAFWCEAAEPWITRRRKAADERLAAGTQRQSTAAGVARAERLADTSDMQTITDEKRGAA